MLLANSNVLFFRSSHQRYFVRKGLLKNFAKFTGKHLCQSLFLIMFQAPPETLLKKRLWHRCFPVNFAKFLKASFLTEHLWWLLLYQRFRMFFFYHSAYIATHFFNQKIAIVIIRRIFKVRFIEKVFRHLIALFKKMVSCNLIRNSFNPFHVYVLFLHLLKTLENFWFSDVFRWYINRTLR